MYIDNITGSLNAATNTAEMLNQQKNYEINQALAKAKMFRDMGQYDKANEMMQQATDTGLLGGLHSLFSPVKEWKVKNPFAGEKMSLLEKRGIQDIKQSPALFGGASAEQGKILENMKEAYTLRNDKGQKIGFDDAGYKKQLMLMGQQASGISAGGALSNVLSEDWRQKELNAYHDKQNRPGLAANIQAYKDLQHDQQLQDNQIAKENAPLIKANKAAEAYNADVDKINAKREAYNKTVEGNQYLVGDEIDKNQQLIDSTLKSINAGGGMAAYMKYVTSAKTLADDHGHDFKPMPPEYFGLGGKGGKGRKLEHFIVQGTDGKSYTVQAYKDQPFSDQMDFINKQMLQLSGKKATFLIGSNPQPKGDVSGDTQSIANKNDADAMALDAAYKAQAKAAYDNTDVPGHIDLLNKDKKAAIANASLGNNPYMVDAGGNVILKAGATSASNQQQKKEPVKEAEIPDYSGIYTK